MEGLDPILRQNLRNFGIQDIYQAERELLTLLKSRTSIAMTAPVGSGKSTICAIAIAQDVISKASESHATESLSLFDGAVYPAIIVVVPTRHLCTEMYDKLIFFSYGTAVRIEAAYGESSIEASIVRITKLGADVVVATPGRLIELLRYEHIYTGNTRTMFLDEAEHLIMRRDMRRQMRTIRSFVEDVPLVSVTSSDSIDLKLQFRNFCAGRPVTTLDVGKYKSQAMFVHQHMMHVEQPYTAVRTAELFHNIVMTDCSYDCAKKGIICAPTIVEADDIALELFRLLNLRDEPMGHTLSVLHSEVGNQRVRERIFNDFRRDRHKRLLICTPAFGHGYSIRAKSIFLTRIPRDTNEYLSQIGRVGRVGHEGHAYVFIRTGTADEQLLDSLKDGHLPRHPRCCLYIDGNLVEGGKWHPDLAAELEARGPHPAGWLPPNEWMVQASASSFWDNIHRYGQRIVSCSPCYQLHAH